MKKYILKNKEIVEEKDLLKWAEWFENTENRRVSSTSLKNGSLSTVFLGIDHSYGEEKPLLFESMAFDTGTEYDNEPYRYSTWQEAEEGHIELVDKINAKILPKA